jgi:hypothetical protein
MAEGLRLSLLVWVASKARWTAVGTESSHLFITHSCSQLSWKESKNKLYTSNLFCLAMRLDISHFKQLFGIHTTLRTAAIRGPPHLQQLSLTKRQFFIESIRIGWHSSWVVVKQRYKYTEWGWPSASVGVVSMSSVFIAVANQRVIGLRVRSKNAADIMIRTPNISSRCPVWLVRALICTSSCVCPLTKTADTILMTLTTGTDCRSAYNINTDSIFWSYICQQQQN